MNRITLAPDRLVRLDEVDPGEFILWGSLACAYFHTPAILEVQDGGRIPVLNLENMEVIYILRDAQVVVIDRPFTIEPE